MEDFNYKAGPVVVKRFSGLRLQNKMLQYSTTSHGQLILCCWAYETKYLGLL